MEVILSRRETPEECDSEAVSAEFVAVRIPLAALRDKRAIFLHTEWAVSTAATMPDISLV